MVAAVVMIRAQREHIPSAAQAIADIEGVAEVYSVSGEWDLVAIVRVPEWEQIANLLQDRAEAVIRGAVAPDSAFLRLDREVGRLLEKRRWMLDRAAARRDETRRENGPGAARPAVAAAPEPPA
jgi:DNA-binding Lrp family transcriptional regulator